MDPDWRSHFPLLEEATYLKSHAFGAMSYEASDALARYAEEWATLGADAWRDEWSQLPLKVGSLIGSLVGSSPSSTIVTTSLSSALAAIDSCFRFPMVQSRVVTTQLERGPIRDYWSTRTAMDETTVRSWDGHTIADETFLAAIDERTAIVTLSHVSPSSTSLDLKRIVAAAHDVDGYVVLDCTNSAGSMPVDLDALGIDFAVGRTDAWLMGGSPTAWLYVHPEIQGQLEPTTSGWGPHGHPSSTPTDPPGIWRFLDGPPTPPALYTLRAAVDLLRSVGIEEVRRRSLELSGQLAQLAEERGLIVTSDTSVDRGPIVTLRVEDAVDTQARLSIEQIVVGVYSSTELAVGPHFYNDDHDLDRLVAELVKG